MTVTAQMSGHAVEWDCRIGRWVFTDTRQPAPDASRPCKKCGEKPRAVCVTIGRQDCQRGFKPIDHCIAGLVERLNRSGEEPHTVASCCGHGERDGEVIMSDGRTLVIKEPI